MERYTECPIGEISQIALQGSGDYEINVEDASILNINYSQNTLTILSSTYKCNFLGADNKQ